VVVVGGGESGVTVGGGDDVVVAVVVHEFGVVADDYGGDAYVAVCYGVDYLSLVEPVEDELWLYW
jgi:hypothetical protein